MHSGRIDRRGNKASSKRVTRQEVTKKEVELVHGVREGEHARFSLGVRGAGERTELGGLGYSSSKNKWNGSLVVGDLLFDFWLPAVVG